MTIVAGGLPKPPGKWYLDWELDDLAGKSVDEIRIIRDEVDERARALLTELAPAAVVRGH